MISLDLSTASLSVLRTLSAIFIKNTITRSFVPLLCSLALLAVATAPARAVMLIVSGGSPMTGIDGAIISANTFIGSFSFRDDGIISDDPSGLFARDDANASKFRFAFTTPVDQPEGSFISSTSATNTSAILFTNNLIALDTGTVVIIGGGGVISIVLPEPSRAMLAGLGLAMLALRRKRAR